MKRLLRSIPILVGLITPVAIIGQSPLARVEALGLSAETVGRVEVYFAPEARSRALEIASVTEAAAALLESELGLAFGVRLAALGPEDWFSEFPGVPYAIPWVSMPERLLFVPSSLEEGILVQGPDRLADQRRTDFTALHEYGHLAAKAYFREESSAPYLPVAWFEELLSTYFAYCYIGAADPEWSAAARSEWRMVVGGYTPPVVSLDWGFMNDLQGPQLAQVYAWYQLLLNLRAAELYDRHGVSFLSMLSALDWNEAENWTTNSLLPRLEELSPGFVSWAEDLTSVAR